MKKVFICSPYAGLIARNINVARELCRKVVELGHAPFAPHLFYPQFLDEYKQSDRDAGIQCGLAWMAQCDEVWIYTDNGISDGMKSEIEHAKKLGKPVVEVKL
jgi:hypothetical protein